MIRHPARERILHFKKFVKGKKKGKIQFAKETKATYGMKRQGKAYNI